jgi:hypothetical protein
MLILIARTSTRDHSFVLEKSAKLKLASILGDAFGMLPDSGWTVGRADGPAPPVAGRARPVKPGKSQSYPNPSTPAR